MRCCTIMRQHRIFYPVFTEKYAGFIAKTQVLTQKMVMSAHWKARDFVQGASAPVGG